jgi:hypothetical protein
MKERVRDILLAVGVAVYVPVSILLAIVFLAPKPGNQANNLFCLRSCCALCEDYLPYFIGGVIVVLPVLFVLFWYMVRKAERSGLAR